MLWRVSLSVAAVSWNISPFKLSCTISQTDLKRQEAIDEMRNCPECKSTRIIETQMEMYTAGSKLYLTTHPTLPIELFFFFFFYLFLYFFYFFFYKFKDKQDVAMNVRKKT